MKKLAYAISIVMAASMSFNMFRSLPTSAYPIVYWVDDNSFLERSTSYYFGLYSDKLMQTVEVRYHCQPPLGINTSYYKSIGYYELDIPIYYMSGATFNTISINGVRPWYDSGFKRNNLEFLVTHTDNTTSSETRTCYVLDEDTDWYEDRDSTFYYTSPTNSSFISFKTGRVSPFGSSAVYNCLAYAIHGIVKKCAVGEHPKSWIVRYQAA